MPQTDLGNMFKLFSRAFAVPTSDLASSIVSGSLLAEMVATWTALELPQQHLDLFSESLSSYHSCDSGKVMRELRRESTRLFLGEKPRVTNSEGLWRKKAEGKTNAVLVVNSYSIEVAEFMRSCGVVRSEGYNDCVDYIEVECEFASFLAESPAFLIEMEKDPIDLLDQFMDRHMKLWVPGFCSDILRNSDNIYYKGLGKFLGEFIKEF